jgi:hypothetical protein
MEDLFFVAVWFVLAIFVGTVAGRRGRGQGWWFLLSLIISPLLGGLILLVVPNLKAAADLASLKKCPRCAEMVQREALVCKHCHTEFAQVAAARDF